MYVCMYLCMYVCMSDISDYDTYQLITSSSNALIISDKTNILNILIYNRFVIYQNVDDKLMTCLYIKTFDDRYHNKRF